MGSTCALRLRYIIYLELCSPLDSSVMTRDRTKRPHVLKVQLFHRAESGLIYRWVFKSSNNRSRRCLLWKCIVLIKGRSAEHLFWARLILVNCLSVPYLPHVVMIHKGAFVLHSAVGFLACSQQDFWRP